MDTVLRYFHCIDILTDIDILTYIYIVIYRHID